MINFRFTIADAAGSTDVVARDHSLAAAAQIFIETLRQGYALKFSPQHIECHKHLREDGRECDVYLAFNSTGEEMKYLVDFAALYEERTKTVVQPCIKRIAIEAADFPWDDQYLEYGEASLVGTIINRLEQGYRSLW